MIANIVLSYENTAEHMYLWANDERNIDFRKDPFEAKRCTISFGATEIIAYLKKLGITTTFGNEPQSDCFNIYIDALDEDFENSEFTLTPLNDGIKILGKSRTGALYGAYEFLRLQGIRWPSLEVEVVPEDKPQALNNIEKEKTFSASMPLGRGFMFEGAHKESTKLWLWMARNRMNLSVYRPYTGKFQKKLGMVFDNGGHIFEAMLDPDNKTENGKTFWEEHRDWYGTDSENEVTKENALMLQFCMTNEGVLDYLADRLIDRINNEWYECDRIQFATFDTWGKSCMCKNCSKLGNGTDRALHLVSQIRERFDKALATGRVDHNVRLVLTSYEGTDTIDPPLNPVPENVKQSGDAIIFWSIMRCYKHTFDDKNCSYNTFYHERLKNWHDVGIIAGEYYNVSKMEDMPLVFTKSMISDIRKYHELGVKGMTYLHVPMINWSVRALTQSIYAQLQWDINTDMDAFVEQYFKDMYNEHAPKMKKAYELIEDATYYIQSWRAWGERSILTQLLRWDGRKPKSLLKKDDHLEKDAINIGYEAAENLKKAYDITFDCWKDEIKNMEIPTEFKTALNPMMVRNALDSKTLGIFEEDLASLRYGVNMMNIITMFTQYHDDLYNGKDTDELWKKIDTLATEMIHYYVPMQYVNSETNIETMVNNSLKRSQLNALYYRCKALRKQG